jgi:hypothetical protein
MMFGSELIYFPMLHILGEGSAGVKKRQVNQLYTVMTCDGPFGREVLRTRNLVRREQ